VGLRDARRRIRGVHWRAADSGSCAGRSRNALFLRRGHAAAGRAAHGAGVVAVAGIDAQHGDLGALAAVGRRVDGHPCGDGAGGHLFPVLAMGLRLNTVVDQRRDVSVPLQDGHLDDAVVKRPTVAVVGEGDRGVDGDFGDLRQYVGGRLLRRCAIEQESCQREKHRYKEEPCFRHFATFQNK